MLYRIFRNEKPTKCIEEIKLEGRVVFQEETLPVTEGGQKTLRTVTRVSGRYPHDDQFAISVWVE